MKSTWRDMLFMNAPSSLGQNMDLCDTQLERVDGLEQTVRPNMEGLTLQIMQYFLLTLRARYG